MGQDDEHGIVSKLVAFFLPQPLHQNQNNMEIKNLNRWLFKACFVSTILIWKVSLMEYFFVPFLRAFNESQPLAGRNVSMKRLVGAMKSSSQNVQKQGIEFVFVTSSPCVTMYVTIFHASYARLCIEFCNIK